MRKNTITGLCALFLFTTTFTGLPAMLRQGPKKIFLNDDGRFRELGRGERSDRDKLAIDAGRRRIQEKSPDTPEDLAEIIAAQRLIFMGLSEEDRNKLGQISEIAERIAEEGDGQKISGWSNFDTYGGLETPED